MAEFFENPKNLFDTEARLKALEGIEKKHQIKIDEENRAGITSVDENVVSDWIRNRIEVPKDRLEGRPFLKVEQVEQLKDSYEADMSSLRKLTTEELSNLLKKVEDESNKGSGLFSMGKLLNGYAIDTVTLQSLQTVGHTATSLDLAEKIYDESLDSDNPEFFDESKFNKIDDLKRTRIVSGFVYLQVPGFQTPIVKLYFSSKKIGYEISEENVRRIAEYIKNERRLLPISSKLEVL